MHNSLSALVLFSPSVLFVGELGELAVVNLIVWNHQFLDGIHTNKQPKLL
ncbi:hypothetical protein ANCCAN_13280 [Ancylostoma caninum]|uniref:Uncharacterized protein n=1 Tax=Ancylostoma caninum TaxID=29170 RepID=A0A368GBX8_ANCCA|nr:hypothetical protein ANCCAN_13280 [Ancylostoma caninum]